MQAMKLLVLATFLLAAGVSAAASGPIVQTPYGAVQGTSDQGVFAFRGIPFAQPPIGALRFAPAQPARSWSGTIDGSKFADGCYANCPTFAFPIPSIMCTPTVSEDCLYLNVYTPTVNVSAKLPVVVFMHGGNYIGGSGGVPLYDGSDLARNQDVVVVTTNYRLGVFGALYTGTVKGNFHTTDQREALKFLQKVVSVFGGNPQLITLTGQSAGAFSVATHLASPKSWPYFQRAIIVSDPFSLLAGTPERAVTLGSKILSHLNCPMFGGEQELQCLRNASSADLLAAQLASNYDPLDGFLSVMMPWVPVVDGDELPYQPLYALTHNHFSKVPVLFGTVANESVQFIFDIAKTPLPAWEYSLLLDAVFNVTAADDIQKFYGPVPQDQQSDARDFLSVLATDYIFYCVNRLVGAALTKTTATFMYLFDKLPSYSEMVYGHYMPYCVHNVCHADDIPFIFNPFKAPMPANFTPPVPTVEEVKLAHFIQTAWGNFARSGNPNPLPNITFPRFNGTENILVNYSTPVSLLNGYRNDVCEFADKYLGYYRF